MPEAIIDLDNPVDKQQPGARTCHFFPKNHDRTMRTTNLPDTFERIPGGWRERTISTEMVAQIEQGTIVVFRIKPRTETNTSARLIAVFGIDEQGHRPIVDEVYFHVRTKDPGWNIPPKIVL